MTTIDQNPVTGAVGSVGTTDKPRSIPVSLIRSGIGEFENSVRDRRHTRCALGAVARAAQRARHAVVMEPRWIGDDRDLVEVVDAVAGEPLYALDTEFHGERS